MKNILILILYISILAACAPAETEIVTATPVPIPPRPTEINTPMPAALWVSPAVPDDLRLIAQGWDIPRVDDPGLATQKLDLSESGALWIYALVAPFPTITDDAAYEDLISTWNGAPAGQLAGRGLLMAESTREAFTARWGEPARGVVRSVSSDELLDVAWSDMSNWAIIPFEEINPKWKVISVDGQSPIHKDFDAELYPLKINFG
ncbi:MAG: hypothetical protein Q7J80_08395, partial [Anaerolineales bacterium]|nr:hypothetical protein [Anaerolineales bacterium]